MISCVCIANQIATSFQLGEVGALVCFCGWIFLQIVCVAVGKVLYRLGVQFKPHKLLDFHAWILNVIVFAQLKYVKFSICNLYNMIKDCTLNLKIGKCIIVLNENFQWMYNCLYKWSFEIFGYIFLIKLNLYMPYSYPLDWPKTP
jgi:hypothetical protein